MSNAMEISSLGCNEEAIVKEIVRIINENIQYNDDHFYLQKSYYVESSNSCTINSTNKNGDKLSLNIKSESNRIMHDSNIEKVSSYGGHYDVRIEYTKFSESDLGLDSSIIIDKTNIVDHSGTEECSVISYLEGILDSVLIELPGSCDRSEDIVQE